MRTFLNHIKNETFDEIKTSLENLWRRMIQLSEFFQYSFVLILKRKCLVGTSRVRCGESGTPSTIIYRPLSIRNGAVSRRYELGCDAPVGRTTVLSLRWGPRCVEGASNDIYWIGSPKISRMWMTPRVSARVMTISQRCAFFRQT